MATEPKLLFVLIPEVPEGAPFEFHPISRSKRPVRYKRRELRDTGVAQTAWVAFFEEILVGLYWKHNEPVPFVFRTPAGVRSLDAGCIKWLINRNPPELELHCDSAGLIEAVTPNPMLLHRYESRRDELVQRLSWNKGGASSP